jgi:hypothetical protein
MALAPPSASRANEAQSTEVKEPVRDLSAILDELVKVVDVPRQLSLSF